MNNDFDIFNAVPTETKGKFVTFKQIGDRVQGTYVDKTTGTDSFGNAQIIYVLKKGDEYFNVGFRTTATVTHDKMSKARFGMIVGFEFKSTVPSKRAGYHDTKIIDPVFSSAFIDEEYVKANQAVVDAKNAELIGNIGISLNAAPAAKLITPIEKTIDEQFNEIVTPTAAATIQTSDPVGAVGAVGTPKPSPTQTVREFALKQGLTHPGMTPRQQVEEIQKYTGLELLDQNSGAMIIKLSSYQPF